MGGKKEASHNLIKIGVQVDDETLSKEWLWARKITETTAKLDNIPFFAEGMALGDLVEFDPNTSMIVRVIERCGRTLHGHFDFEKTRSKTLEAWRKIVAHMKRYDIAIEGMSHGFFSLAVPLDVDDEQIKGICAACPVPFTLYFD